MLVCLRNDRFLCFDENLARIEPHIFLPVFYLLSAHAAASIEILALCSYSLLPQLLLSRQC